MCPVTDPLRTINFLLCETAKGLKRWSAKAVGSIRTQIQVAKEVIFHLELAQDHRSLSAAEQALRRFLEIIFLGLTSLEHTIARQRSSMWWLHEGGANVNFFHLHTNQWWRKNFIPSLEVDGVTVVAEDDKTMAAFNYYNVILGTSHNRGCAIDFKAWGLPSLDLSLLGCPFMEAKVWEVVKELPLNMVPGHDGFIGRFNMSTWSIIKGCC